MPHSEDDDFLPLMRDVATIVTLGLGDFGVRPDPIRGRNGGRCQEEQVKGILEFRMRELGYERMVEAYDSTRAPEGFQGHRHLHPTRLARQQLQDLLAASPLAVAGGVRGWNACGGHGRGDRLGVRPD